MCNEVILYSFLSRAAGLDSKLKFGGRRQQRDLPFVQRATSALLGGSSRVSQRVRAQNRKQHDQVVLLQDSTIVFLFSFHYLSSGCNTTFPCSYPVLSHFIILPFRIRPVDSRVCPSSPSDSEIFVLSVCVRASLLCSGLIRAVQ